MKMYFLTDLFDGVVHNKITFIFKAVSGICRWGGGGGLFRCITR